jgi:hypothetical protein
MSTEQKKQDAAEERPLPSQAEGDRETIEEDLKEKGLGDSSEKSDK